MLPARGGRRTLVILPRSLKRCLARCTARQAMPPQPEIEKLPERNRHARFIRKFLSRNKLDGEPRNKSPLSCALSAPS
jgi:hypothetical protein